ncbi:MAG: YlxR family protein [Eubacteriales bacterium]|nr:YlxR family protein [Eubacteriales bacterium]MDD4421677.1 YlxR family protein [Eubacteriales bacterium]HBR31286.1 DUF448 domain-containing protein [Clostridiales bacterium]
MIQRKKPTRKCVGCGEMKEKTTLLRIVRDKDDSIFIDPTGKKSGRGAYICKNFKCLEAAKKGHRIERAFETKIPAEIYDFLGEQLRGLTE